jgi:BlaI family transcriptional regulator, penicillinase repressor
MEARPALSASEREVLKVLWDHGSGTTREINEVLEQQGRQWAYTTVATLLQRLSQKKYVAGDPSAVPHVYRALVSRNELLDRRLKDAADEFCDGRAAPLVLALVQGNQFSVEEVARLRRLLDEAAGTLSAPSAKPSRQDI